MGEVNAITDYANQLIALNNRLFKQEIEGLEFSCCQTLKGCLN